MRITASAFALVVLFTTVPHALAKHGESESGDSDDDSLGGASSTTPTQTSSSVSPSPTSSPIQFLPPSNATVCQNILLEWQSSNVIVPITLAITNQRGTGAPSSSSANTDLVSQTLSTNLSASADQFMWDPVDVPPGSYVAVAFDTSQTAGIFAQSSPFFVQSGQNSSCLAATSSSTSTTSIPDSPTPTSGSATASGGAGAQPKKLSAGVLGGVVAGVVVGVLLLILAATFPHYWKDALMRRRVNRHPGGPYHLF